MSGIKDMRRALEQKKGQRKQIRAYLAEQEGLVRTARRNVKWHEEARTLIQEAGRLTQAQLEYHISNIVTLAFNSIFDDPYTLSLNFVLRRGRTEVDVMFERDGELFSPMDGSGGGPVDVASFALRVALHTMERPQARGVIILDEPFRFLSSELQERAGAMLSQLSKELKLQFIMVSHNTDLIESADRAFEVRRRKGVSQVINV